MQGRALNAGPAEVEAAGGGRGGAEPKRLGGGVRRERVVVFLFGAEVRLENLDLGEGGRGQRETKKTRGETSLHV